MEIDGKNLTTQVKEQKNNNIGSKVCSFWLKGICKNGANCTFLHERIEEKIPECPHGMNCIKLNNGCPFKHTVKIQKECHAYNAGYCPLGKNCKDLHKKRDICLNYLLGFCPEGPNCKLYHLKTMITPGQDNLDYLAKSIPDIN